MFITKKKNYDYQLGLEDAMLLAELRVEEKKLKEKREKAEARVRSFMRLGDPNEKPKIGRPNVNEEIKSILGKRKRERKPIARKKKVKKVKSKPKPKNQPSIASFFNKVKK